MSSELCASQEAPFVLVTVIGTSYMPEEVKGIEIIITIGRTNQNATQSESKQVGAISYFLQALQKKRVFFDGFLLYPAH